MMDDLAESQSLRYAIYAILIVTSLASVAGRILSAQSRDRHTPFFSANDRSRWSTISSLVDHGTYAIDDVRKRPGWKSIDMVRHRDAEGRMRYYSSKPPLLPTMLAGPYWLIKRTVGISFDTHPFEVARTMLLLVSWLPLGVYFVLMTCWIERNGESDFGRIFLVAATCWGTFLTPFAITLNNHSPAAFSVLIALLCLLRIWQDEQPAAWVFVVAGLAAGFAAANELPALSFVGLLSVTLLWLAPRQTLLWYVPALAVVAIAFFSVTYWAHGSLRPPYAHRDSGDNWYDYPGSYWYGNRQGVDLGEPSKAAYLFHVLLGHHGFFSLTPLWLLGLAGSIGWAVQRDLVRRYLGALALVLLVVCVGFYVFLRPQGDRNYGGVCSGFRWLFWLTPLWLMVSLPAAEWFGETRTRRVVALLLLFFSVLSVSVPAGNPWTHPWIYQWVLAR
jgi:hypothetical protein